MYTGEHDSSFISFIISFTFTDRVPIIFRTFIRGIENKEKRGKNNRKAMLCTGLVLYIYIYIRHLHCIVFHRGLQRIIYPNRDIFLPPPFFPLEREDQLHPPLALANIYRVNRDIYHV